MFEDLKKTLDKGIEFALSTKDKVEKAVKEFAEENNLTKEEAKKLMDQAIKKSEEARKTLEEKIIELQKGAMEKMNLVTKEDYKKLEDRIKKLEISRKPQVKRTPVKKNIKVASKGSKIKG
jgi:polyhydroxyalkanoate synthesis regulator phasin